MSSSPTVTLFTQPGDFRQPPTTFVASILIHAVVAGITSFIFLYTPHIDTRVAAERLVIRRLDLEMPRDLAPRSRNAVYYPRPRVKARPARSLRAGRKPAIHPPALRLIAKTKPSPQTLVQPDLLNHVTLDQKIPIPQVMIWTQRALPVKNIVAPRPVRLNATRVTPSLKAPNQEPNPAEVEIASSEHPALNQLVLPGNTSPVVVEGPQLYQTAPATVSQLSEQPTPTALLSLSDLHMPVGTVNLPPVNETASASDQSALAPGKTADPAQAGNGNSAGAGHRNAGGQRVAASDRAPGAAAPGQGGHGSDTKITRPINGQFGAVIVGNSLQDQYPEVAGVWSGRIAYTVFLHVGLAKSWILQYALPHTADASAGGNVAHLKAPWPYNIVRPDLVPGSIDSNALMVHGFVNRQGRFEQLHIVFPQTCPQAQFVLDALERWQFRPASLNGHADRVEVLLIIPEEN